MIQVQICQECGEPYDSDDTGSSICQDCRNLTHFKLRKPDEETHIKSRQAKENWQSNG
jgi:DNA-directed RNA polymerase subunit RPC12/RpoP